MVQSVTQGRLVVRQADGPADMARALGLRQQAFHAGKSGDAQDDADRFDARAAHVLVLERETDRLLCCFRVQRFDGASLDQSYAAQFYGLAPLAAFPGRMLELGRFCLHPDCHDPDVLRLAWAAVARIVDAGGIALLFGCCSFAGADPARHRAGLAGLVAHVAPACWRPLPRAAETVRLRDCPGAAAGLGDRRQALAAMPALLRTYLGMGAWVSDHAVIDRRMDTLHVLTGVEVARIPGARARALRAIGSRDLGYLDTAFVSH